jgi:hypothetical protein
VQFVKGSATELAWLGNA